MSRTKMSIRLVSVAPDRPCHFGQCKAGGSGGVGELPVAFDDDIVRRQRLAHWPAPCGHSSCRRAGCRNSPGCSGSKPWAFQLQELRIGAVGKVETSELVVGRGKARAMPCHCPASPRRQAGNSSPPGRNCRPRTASRQGDLALGKAALRIRLEGRRHRGVDGAVWQPPSAPATSPIAIRRMIRTFMTQSPFPARFSGSVDHDDYAKPVKMRSANAANIRQSGSVKQTPTESLGIEASR
jgi:hypothetical protein